MDSNVKNNISERELAEKVTVKKVDSLEIQYDKDNFISGPYRIENGTVPINILEFHHSYGYNCQRYFNFCVADPNTIIFASGCLIHIYDVLNKTLKIRRGSTGRGIGHIAKNPMISHIAVGENGINPPIIIYQWPSLAIVTILYEGTTQIYSHLSYSPDGDLLVSQGGGPDYLITVWNWKKSSIMLRCKSHSQDIYNVMFSSSIAGRIITSGTGHIKFWQMSSTFTGFKLKGELGRFGRTEISDIIGVLAMPDGKVVSGCEWGNILLWDEGLIKLEVRRKNKQPCHDNMITQFEYNNGELISIGMDGWIRVWYYETIDQADPPDDDRFIGVEPIYEFKIGESLKNKDDDFYISSMLMSIQKKDPSNTSETLWYAQDGNGGVWLIDLNILQSQIVSLPKKLFTCHAGAVNDIASCTWGEFIATCGEDGRLNIYNYLENKIILSHKFRDSGTCVIWFPCTVESTGSTIICAFESGILRMVTVSIKSAKELDENKNDCLRLIQVIKPHKKSITNMSTNVFNNLLVSGSEDSTIFIFSIKITDKYPSLIPIGFINMPSSVTVMTWKPQHSTTILLGCLHGDCVEIDLPDVPQSYTTLSYELINCKMRMFKFHSVKSKIRRENAQLEIERNKAIRIQNLHKKIEELKAIDPENDIDKEPTLADIGEDPPLPDIHIPQIPNRVLTINYSTVGTIYLTMAGFDAGFIYEYPIPQNDLEMPNEPIKSTQIYDAIDTEIHSWLFYDNRYVIMGMAQGEIRVCRLNHQDLTDLSDYWILSMHDTYTGYIPKIILNYDKKMLFTCGHDGNIFSFIVNDNSSSEKTIKEIAAPPYSLPKNDVDDIEDVDYPNLEQVITKNEENRVMFEAKKRKDHTLMLLRKMSEEYCAIMDENNSLLKSQQIPHEEFELDPRITEDFNNQLKSEMDLVHEKMAFKVEKCRLALKKLTEHFIESITCIPFAVCRISNPNRMVHSLQEKTLDKHFAKQYAELLEEIEKVKATERSSEDISSTQIEEEMAEQRMKGVESFLKGLNSSTMQNELGTQMNHLLKKYRERKEKMEKRAQEWKIMNSCKPDPNADDQEDIDAIEKAKQTIGDYKLKTFMNFNLNEKLTSETTLDKHKQLLDCRKKTHNIRVDFNEQLKTVRDKKLEFQREVMNLVEKLKSIHKEIPEKYVKPLPEILDINYSIEYPEKNLELEKYISVAERVKEARRIRKLTDAEKKMAPMDEEYEILLLDEKLLDEKLNDNKQLSFLINANVYETKINIPRDVIATLNTNDGVQSIWEHEMKLERMERKIYEQDRIINHITRNYETIDKELDELEHKRLSIQVDSCYAELYQLTLNQELIILRDCEAKEKILIDKVNENLTAQAISKQQIQRTVANIDNKNRETEKFQDNIKELTSQFLNMIRDDKYTEFLRRIFKKKNKLPNTTEDLSMDSSSSDSTTDDDDSDSIDSRNIDAFYHLNENICPTGCNEDLYNAAFTMRNKRNEYESEIKHNAKIIDSLKREVEQNTKKLKIIENSLSTSQQMLLTFMQEKQQKLNAIDATVILNLNQLQHFKDNETLVKLCDCVVFDKRNLSRLYTRVSQLQQETIDQKLKHKKNQVHLRRMKIDCKYMNDKIKKLNEEINEEMCKKFGKQISLTDLYEAILRRMVIDMKCDVKEIIKSYDKEIRCVKEKYNEQVVILENVIQDNTKKLSILTVLEEDHENLRKILKRVPVSEESMAKIEYDYEKELTKLETILRNQLQQRELFRNEIQNFKMKTRPLPPICSHVKSEKSPNKTLKLNKQSKLGDVNKYGGFSNHQSQIVLIEKIPSKVFAKDFDESIQMTDDQIIKKIQSLLSRIIEMKMNTKEIKENIQDLLHEILCTSSENESNENIRQMFEKNIKNIITDDDQREIILEILSEILCRLKTTSRDIEINSVEITWDVKPKIDELLETMNIKKDINTPKELMSLLKKENGVDAAANYLTQKIKMPVDDETLTALRGYVMRTLNELEQQIDESEGSDDGVNNDNETNERP